MASVLQLRRPRSPVRSSFRRRPSWMGAITAAGARVLSWCVVMSALLALGPPGGAVAAELVMLEQPGCAWCKRWNEEIAPAYPNTPEGRRAPLRRVDISRPWPQDLDGISPDVLTPTFILIEDGQEVARLRGYPGEHFFWPVLGEMIEKLGSTTPEAD